MVDGINYDGCVVSDLSLIKALYFYAENAEMQYRLSGTRRVAHRESGVLDFKSPLSDVSDQKVWLTTTFLRTLQNFGTTSTWLTIFRIAKEDFFKKST